MDNNTILIKRKTVYGVDKFYPVNDLADMLCDIANTKTLPGHMLRVIERYGLFEIMESLRGGSEIAFRDIEGP